MPGPQNFPLRWLNPIPSPGKTLSPALWAGLLFPMPYQKAMGISPPERRSLKDSMMSHPRGFIPSELCMNYKTNIKICTTLDMTEKETATHSSVLAWSIPGMGEPGGLQCMGSLESDMTERLPFHFSLSTFMHWRRKRRPTPVFLPGESRGRGAWWAAVYGVPQSQTRLKQLSRHDRGLFPRSIVLKH